MPINPLSSIFISHSSHDKAEAELIRDWLATPERGFGTLFLDFDPDFGIPAGARWEQVLYERMQRCRAVVAIVSRHWVASRWCFAEAVLARSRGKQLFLLRVDDATVPPVLDDIQIVDLSIDRAGALARLATALRSTFAWTGDRPPFPGLSAFDERDVAIYFGRQSERAECTETLEALRYHGKNAPRLLLLLGPSGSGKSSLLRCGVLPSLNRQPEKWIVLPPFRPLRDPLAELATALGTLIAPAQPIDAWQQRTDDIEACGATLLRTFRALRVQRRVPEATVLLVVDQLEELFSLAPAATAARFVALLCRLAEVAGHELLIAATLRTDFLEQFQAHVVGAEVKGLPALRYRHFDVEPLAPSRIPEIVYGPAEVAGIEVDPDLVLEIVREVTDSRALPLVAFALRRLWETSASEPQLVSRPDDKFALRLSNYRDLGGIHGVIRSTASMALEDVFASPEKQAVLRNALIPRLARTVSGGARVKRQGRLSSFSDSERELLSRLVAARLMVTHEDIIELTHEAVLDAWPQLAAWLSEDAAHTLQLEALERSATEWQEGGRTDDLLVHRDRRLREAQDLTSQPRFQPPAESVTSAYLIACIRAHRRSRRWLVSTVAAGVILAVLAASAGTYALFTQRVGAAQARADKVLLLTAQAASRLDAGETSNALGLLEEAHSLDSDSTGVLSQELRYPEAFLGSFTNSEELAACTILSTPWAGRAICERAGKYLLVQYLGRNQADLVALPIPSVFLGPGSGTEFVSGDPTRIAVTPDGRTSVYIKTEGSIALVRADGTSLSFEPKMTEIRHIAVSMDGNLVAVAGEYSSDVGRDYFGEERLEIWDVSEKPRMTGEEGYSNGHRDWEDAVIAFHPTLPLLVIGRESIGASGTSPGLSVLDVTSMCQLQNADFQNDIPISSTPSRIAFSEDGSVMVLGMGLTRTTLPVKVYGDEWTALSPDASCTEIHSPPAMVPAPNVLQGMLAAINSTGDLVAVDTGSGIVLHQVEAPQYGPINTRTLDSVRTREDTAIVGLDSSALFSTSGHFPINRMSVAVSQEKELSDEWELIAAEHLASISSIGATDEAIVTTGDGSVFIAEVSPLRVRGRLSIVILPGTKPSFSADSTQMLASLNTGELARFSMPEQKLIDQARCHQGRALGAMFLSGSQLVVNCETHVEYWRIGADNRMQPERSAPWSDERIVAINNDGTECLAASQLPPPEDCEGCKVRTRLALRQCANDAAKWTIDQPLLRGLDEHADSYNHHAMTSLPGATYARFSNSGKWISLLTSEGGLLLVESGTGKVTALDGVWSTAYESSFSPDDKFIAVATGGTPQPQENSGESSPGHAIFLQLQSEPKFAAIANISAPVGLRSWYSVGAAGPAPGVGFSAITWLPSKDGRLRALAGTDHAKLRLLGAPVARKILIKP